MKTIGINVGYEDEIGGEGYVYKMEPWTKEKANVVAKDEVPEGLTESHWKIVECIRRYYLDMGTVPPVRMLARRTGFNLREMQKLFPSGLTKGACKIAGIPREAIKPSFLYP